MRRRGILAAAVAAALPPAALRAQPSRQAVVGALVVGQPEPFWTAFKGAMRRLGHVEGGNARFELRSADFVVERLDALAAELARLPADVIVTVQTPPTLAAKRAAGGVPIVMAGVGDAVGLGLVASLARPGGNVTGFSTGAAELAAKSLELIREILPGARRVAALANAPDPFSGPFIDNLRVAADAAGAALVPALVASPRQLEEVFATLARERVDVVIVQPSLPAKAVADLALRARLPSVSSPRLFAESGGLLSYGADYGELYKRAAGYVDRILKGGKPAELPVQSPERFELIINLRTVRALGLQIPSTFLQRADEVIE